MPDVANIFFLLIVQSQMHLLASWDFFHRPPATETPAMSDSERAAGHAAGRAWRIFHSREVHQHHPGGRVPHFLPRAENFPFKESPPSPSRRSGSAFFIFHSLLAMRVL